MLSFCVIEMHKGLHVAKLYCTLVCMHTYMYILVVGVSK